MKNNGLFVISLDFELYWGVRDKRSLDSYGDAIKKVHEVVPETLALFRHHGVKATFATVGLLFAEDKAEMLSYSPEKKPGYKNSNLSPYTDGFKLVKETPAEDPYHFSCDLIKMIRDEYPEQEIGSHTFSHYYCQEPGQTLEEFEADLKAAIAIAADKGIRIRSLVFPRNQYNNDYLDTCMYHGITSYRGNETNWFHNAQSEETTTLLKRVVRTLDCYINLSGHHGYDLQTLKGSQPLNIPSSRFLRPYNTKGGRILEWLKVRRIKKAMTHAAKNGLVYHLWWHPHNFGANTSKNMDTLRAILAHYNILEKKFQFSSKTMSEVTLEL